MGGLDRFYVALAKIIDRQPSYNGRYVDKSIYQSIQSYLEFSSCHKEFYFSYHTYHCFMIFC